MDWPLAIDKNREKLLRIVLALMASLGLVTGGALTSLPRLIYRKALMIVQPAEAAVRRLIMMAAYELELRKVILRAGREAGSSQLDFRWANDCATRLPTFNLIDPLKDFEFETLDYSGFGQFDNEPCVNAGRVTAVHLGHRLLALKNALENLPKQACRLARWYAQRDLVLRQNRPHRLSPMRPGFPPGYRRKPVHPVEEVLLDCHSLASHARERPDSS
jgi:hypothetical protein